MRKIFLSLFCLSLSFSLQHSSQAFTSATVVWNGSGGLGSNSLRLIDNGAGNFFKFNDVSHTFNSTFIVSDGNGIALGDSFGFLPSPDFVGNGLRVVSGPFPNIPNVNQIVLETNTPFTPITMSVNHTDLQLQEIVYVNNAKDYAIIELRAVNQGAAATPIFLAVANDWDVGGYCGNTNGFDAARGLIFQYSALPIGKNYTIGMTSLNNSVDQFLLGYSLDLLGALIDPAIADPYVLQRHFLNNTKPTEECDDGGNAPADGAGDTCSPKCHNAVAGQKCGNGTIEGDEECDDGNLASGDGCDNRCLDEGSLCGNGTLDAGEECDDDNRLSGDGCDLDCKVEFLLLSGIGSCGDGMVNNGATGSQADTTNGLCLESSLSVKFAGIQPNQGATAAFCLVGATGTNQANSEANLKAKTDDCLAFYRQNIAVCGNGIQNAGEACDDGNNVDSDGCRNNCTLTTCGNNVLEAGEACDDGNTVNGDGCESDCTLSSCGNNILDPGEACDDGNKNDSDSCTNACTVTANNGSQSPNSGSQSSGCSLSETAEGASAVFRLLPFLGAGMVAWRRRLR